MTRNISRAAIAVALCIAPLAHAGPVSATPGYFTGTIVYNGPVQPDSISIDARDATNTYTAHADASQGQPTCPAASSTWCYQITVESALAGSYWLRPIALISKSSPVYIYSRIPFPVQPLVGITAGATVPLPPITYTPGQLSGSLSAIDMNSVPLQLKSMYFSAHDNSNTFPEPCGGSLEFCPFNSVFNTAVPPPAGPAPFQLFLKPTDDYKFLSQSFTLDEGSLRQSVVSWNYTQHLGSLTAGQNLVQNHPFHEVASVTGNISLGQPVYNLQVDIGGNTTTIDPVSNAQLTFNDSFNTTNYNSPQPLPFSNYTGRIFDFADFTKPFSLRPAFTLSPDGLSSLTFPPQTFTLNPGDHKTIDFTGTSATISGKVVFDPPYAASNIYPGIQAEAPTATGYGVAQTSLNTNAQGGLYSMTVFGGNWDYWRFGWNFNLGDPNFHSLYNVNQFLDIHVPVANGATVQKDFQFDTALLKVYFSAPAGTSISDPQLVAVSGAMVNGQFVPDGLESATADTANQKLLAVAEARVVLRVRPGKAFRITPSAVINVNPNVASTGRTDFSPFVIQPQKGDITVVGVPGYLALTVTGPQDGQVLNTCTVPVTGYATGTQNITITVNGQTVATQSANDPADPNKVTFTTTVAGQGANTTITVVASSPTNAPVTSVLHVSATSAAPPTVALQLATTMMWPPQHDLINVGLTGQAAASCGVQNPPIAVKVYSNESDTLETGTGNFSPDAKEVATSTLRLRAERQGSGSGRVYLIAGSASAQGGATGYACTAVVVPQSQSPEDMAAVNAMAAAAVTACNATGQPPAAYVQVGTGPVIGPKQ